MITMKFIKIIAVSTLLLFGGSMFGQEKIIAHDDEQDKKYTPNSGSVFNLSLGRKNQNKPDEVTIKNSIKFSPTALARQKVVFFYERHLFEGLVINLGVGKSFGDDYFQKTFLSNFKEDDGEFNTLSVGEILSKSNYYGSNVYLHAGLRYYFSGTPFDNFFLEGTYRNESIDYEVLKPTASRNGFNIIGSPIATFKMNAFTFGFGTTSTTGQRNNITNEFFMNFGIKFFSYTQFDLIPSAINATYQNNSLEQSTRILPTVNIGYSFGFGF
jgi:hypothetical protein